MALFEKGVHRAGGKKVRGRKPEAWGQRGAAVPRPPSGRLLQGSGENSAGVPGGVDTKLLVPRVRPLLVHRDRLAARLEAGMSGVLTLLCAPAGFGKTTLVVDWLRSRASEAHATAAVAWLALDEGDNEPVQFVRLLVAALRPTVPGIGEAALAMTGSSQPPLSRAGLTRLINELVASPREIILVLDDYHVIRQPSIHQAVEFILEHLPPRLHVVIASREDPPFALSRLRARGAVCELRAGDLRFLDAETAAFFRDVMELPVTAGEAAALGAYTEGWIAGLQMAALSIPARDVAGFIAGAGESNRYIVDYLGAEVLARQPRAVQSFLLRTSVLGRLSGPLCEAVLGAEGPEGGAQAMLEQIERANLFLMPLDMKRRWYRYDQLFAEFLRVQLEQTEPGLAPDLHRRASAWYEAHGLVHEAITHALAVPDSDRAASFIEQHHMSFLLHGQRQMVLGWCGALPRAVMQSRPRLSVGYAYALCVTNQEDAAEAYLQAAEQHLRPELPPKQAGFVRGHVAVIRALMAGTAGDLTHSVALAGQALDLLPASEMAGRTLARVLAGRAFKVSGDVTPASERAVAAAVAQAKTAGLPVAMRIGLALLARMHVLQGRLRRAATVFAEAEHVLGPDMVTGVLTCSFGPGDLLREWNDFGGADRLLARGIASISERSRVDAYVVAQGYIALARLRQARGDASGAMAALDEFVRVAGERGFTAPVLAYAAAVRAHLWLMQGNLVAATHWADTCGLGLDDPLSFLREPEYLVLARVLIANKDRAAVALLDRLLENAEAYGRMGSVIEILVLRAVALQALGEPAGALAALERALALGEPEGYVRVFVDEGAPGATLLRRGRAAGIAPEYAARLLRAFGTGRPDPSRAHPVAPVASGTAPAQSGEPILPEEPLTARERDVLRLIVAGASNQEIAQTLVVTAGTVKTHVYHIFGKLGTRRRTQAIARAKVLKLD